METMGRVYPPSRVEFMELALEQVIEFFFTTYGYL